MYNLKQRVAILVGALLTIILSYSCASQEVSEPALRQTMRSEYMAEPVLTLPVYRTLSLSTLQHDWLDFLKRYRKRNEWHCIQYAQHFLDYERQQHPNCALFEIGCHHFHWADETNLAGHRFLAFIDNAGKLRYFEAQVGMVESGTELKLDPHQVDLVYLVRG